jgi:diguanylate cyclase (GGDEF)-like protein/PAS domain S-box-containing protein
VRAHRRDERSLPRADELAELLFSDAPHGVAILDLQGVVLKANAALAVIAGCHAGELDGTRLASFAVADDGAFDQHLAAALSVPGEAVDAEWTMRHRHGGAVHVLLRSRVLREDRGVEDDEPGADVILIHVVDVSERHRFEQRLTHMASHDVLTGLANRRDFDERLTAHQNWCARYGPNGALLLLDLDNFKEVNDTLGHGAGDQLIISTASLLRSAVTATDVVARLGGDEFAVLLTDSDATRAEAVAADIVARIREFTSTLDGTRRRVTASIGVVTLRAAVDHGGDVLALADMTMYDAKDAGRDRYILLDENSSRQPRSGARLAWQERIERALENDDFTLHLQPILDLKSNRIVSAEALVRLSDADELVPPARFLYIAERTGMVPALDAWVVRHSVEMLAGLRAIAPEFRLEVNLSGHSIGRPDIEAAIVDSLREFGVDPSALVLEITETAAVADVAMARSFAERMTSLGCKFALDDFGAGFGSFYYLKHLLFDYVKIDGEFVANVHRSAIDRTILRSIVGIAHDLGKLTVAEFVAEPAILEVVRAEGVDLAQGYLTGVPVPVDEFVATYLQQTWTDSSCSYHETSA